MYGYHVERSMESCARYQVRTVGGTIPGKKGESSFVELAMEVPFNLRRFQEMEAQRSILLFQILYYTILYYIISYHIIL